MFQGLSDGMKGGDIRYIVTSHDYGCGFVEMLMDSSLVHLMLFVNHDSVPLGLAHDSYAMYLSFEGFRCLALRRGMAMEVTSCL